VYTLNPTFRAENSKSRLHLAEFYMIEAELAFLDNIHDLCNTIEQFIKSVLNRVLESHEEELLTYRYFAKPNQLGFFFLRERDRFDGGNYNF
jgi:Aspartyl/asparaginyl-tRNA synthetases